jgi:UPF0755 protein
MRSMPSANPRLRVRVSRRAALIAAVAAAGLMAGCGGSAKEVRVIVPRGSFREATDSLAKAGVVRFPLLFRVYARLKSGDRAIKAGTYVFPAGVAWHDVLDDLQKGHGLELAVTLPEGMPLSQSVPRLARELQIPAESLDAAVRDASLRERLNVKTPTLEGYLFPDTYRFPFGTPAAVVLETLVARFEHAWKPAWTARLDTVKMTRHEIVTLASIVEEEARVDSERPIIAGVYLNRLKKGMPLQADPTVRYALGKYRDRVLYKDLKVESPYNTYRVKGLPPGPVSSPGEKSLEAALYPASVPWLFFVAHPDGHHEFTKTFGEHRVANRGAKAERAARTAKKPT